jgi:D-amino-acid dehydrogenase
MNIVIVGGGVTGLFCAHYLTKDGHSVSVIEKSATGSETSVYNAGLLTPSLAPTPGMGVRKVFSPYIGRQGVIYISPRRILANTRWFRIALRKGPVGYDDKIARMGQSSLKLYRNFFDEVGFQPDVVEGVAALFRDEESAKKTHLAQGGKLLDEHSISQMGYRGLRGGVMFEKELSVNPAKLYRSLWDAAFTHGPAKLVVGEDVKLVMEQGKIVQVSVDGTRIPCDIVVLTAGSWSRELCRQLNYDPQILPARGLAVLFDTGGEEIITTPAVLEDYGMGLAQHNQRTLRLTGFFEMVGFQKEFSDNRKKWLLDRFRKHVVKSDRVKIVEEGVGFRPCTPDQIPVVGLVPGCQNVYVASGNCRLGVTLAPATAEVVRSMISGVSVSKQETWYEPSRFVN